MTFTHRSQLAIFALVATIAGPACTGMTLGENTPGGSHDTYLEDGSIAVDPLTETVYVMRRSTVTREDESGYVYEETTSKHLYSVDPDSGAPRLLADVSDLADLRMLFPAGQVLLMGERGGTDVLRVLDSASGAVVREIETSARYHGTRTSPSGRFVVAADNNDPDVPIHLIDTRNYETRELPHDGVWLEAMWANGGDTLVAMVDYHRSWGLVEPTVDEARMRFLAWDVADLADNGFPTEGAFFANPLFDVEVEGVTRDSAFSFSWVGVSPDDAYAVFPVRAHRVDDPVSTGPGGYADWQADLLVIDFATGNLRRVENGFGPVGFTPDGSTIVSYRYTHHLDEMGYDVFEAMLLLVDSMALAEEEMPIPFDGGPSYFVTREGNYVVVAAAWGGEELVLFDLDAGSMSRVAGAEVGLHEFVSRVGYPELWLVDTGTLYRLDLMSSSIQPMSLPMEVARINILPSRDRLVLGDARGTELTFFDPMSRSVTRRVTLPPVDMRL